MRWRIKNKKKIKTNDFYYDLSFCIPIKYNL